MGISEQSTLLCEQKLLTSRQIFRYAVPARTVTKKHCRVPRTDIHLTTDTTAVQRLKVHFQIQVHFY